MCVSKGTGLRFIAEQIKLNSPGTSRYATENDSVLLSWIYVCFQRHSCQLSSYQLEAPMTPRHPYFARMPASRGASERVLYHQLETSVDNNVSTGDQSSGHIYWTFRSLIKETITLCLQQRFCLVRSLSLILHVDLHPDHLPPLICTGPLFRIIICM